MPFNEDTMRQLVVLVFGSIIGGLAWLARKLAGGWHMTPLEAVGGLLGSALACFSFGALVLTLFPAPDLFILGAAGPVGWVGGQALAAMARWLEKRTGINVIDEE